MNITFGEYRSVMARQVKKDGQWIGDEIGGSNAFAPAYSRVESAVTQSASTQGAGVTRASIFVDLIHPWTNGRCKTLRDAICPADEAALADAILALLPRAEPSVAMTREMLFTIYELAQAKRVRDDNDAAAADVNIPSLKVYVVNAIHNALQDDACAEGGEVADTDPGPGPHVEGQSAEWKAKHILPPIDWKALAEAAEASLKTVSAINLVHIAERDDAKASLAEAQAEIKALESGLEQEIQARDFAQDCLQQSHIRLGGDGEWTAKLGQITQPPNTGDLHYDVPALAADVLERAEAAESARDANQRMYDAALAREHIAKSALEAAKAQVAGLVAFLERLHAITGYAETKEFLALLSSGVVASTDKKEG